MRFLSLSVSPVLLLYQVPLSLSIFRVFLEFLSCFLSVGLSVHALFFVFSSVPSIFQVSFVHISPVVVHVFALLMSIMFLLSSIIQMSRSQSPIFCFVLRTFLFSIYVSIFPSSSVHFLLSSLLVCIFVA